MSREVEDFNRRLLRARDAMDRAYAEPLDVAAVAAVAHMSAAHFSRTFREIVGVPPSAYRAQNGPMLAPGCIQMMAMRPLGASHLSSFGEADEPAVAVA